MSDKIFVFLLVIGLAIPCFNIKNYHFSVCNSAFAELCTKAPEGAPRNKCRELLNLSNNVCKKYFASRCGIVWILNPTTGSCYRIANGEYEWDSAKAKCETFGSQLASIKSSSENNFVKALLKKINKFDRNVGRIGFWIGGNAFANQNRYVWTDNTPWTFDDWISGEPNNLSNEKCLQMKVGDYKWNNAPCSVMINAVCKK